MSRAGLTMLSRIASLWRIASWSLAALLSLGGRSLRAEELRSIELRDGLPLLFADDSGIEKRSGVIRTVHPARTRQAPVLEAQQPWEGSRVYVYGSVYFDPATQRYSIWYLGHPDVDEAGNKPAVPGFRKGKGDMVLYASSADGLHWDKPALGLHEFQGSKANNIVFDLHSPSVLRDSRDPDPARRFKMMGTSSGKYYAAISADGLKWVSYPDKKPVLMSSDNISLTQDPETGDYLAYHRRPTDVPGRTISLSRSHDFKTWSEPELVFAPDAEDNAWCSGPGERTEVNNMSVLPHAAGFLGLPTIFRVLGDNRKPSEVTAGQSPTDGIVEVQLVTSADGRTWQRTRPRVNVIARGNAGGFDAGTILGVASTSVDAGAETWIYYTALTTSHGAPVPPKRISIGRAEWRRHGFVSLDSGERGRVETKAVRLTSPTVLINVNAIGGEVRAGVVEADGRPITGLSIEESEPVNLDVTQGSLRWKSDAVVPIDRPVKLILEMKQASLFSLSCGGLAHVSENKP